MRRSTTLLLAIQCVTLLAADVPACGGRLRARLQQRHATMQPQTFEQRDTDEAGASVVTDTKPAFAEVDSTVYGQTATPNYGVVENRLSPHERVSVNGHVIPKQTLFNRLIVEAAAQSAIPDDRSRLSLTVVGKPNERAQALQDLQAPEFERLRADALIQQYDPDDVMVNAKYWGGPIGGHPSILLQRADGTPLWGANEYLGKETWLAFAKADPNFKIDDVPGLGKPAPICHPLVPVCFVAGGLAAVVLSSFLRKRA